MNFDLAGLEAEEELGVDVHMYGVFGSCLSIGEDFAPIHKDEFEFPGSVTR